MKRLAMMGMMLALGGCGALSGNSVDVTAREASGYPVDRYERSVAEGPLLHAIGIYEASGGHSSKSHPVADATVEVESQGGREIYLALSSYEPVRWRLTGAGLADVKGVYLAGYNRHEVVGIEAGRVVNASGPAPRGQSNAGWTSDDEVYEEPAYAGSGEDGEDTGRVSCTYTYWEGSGGGCESAIGLVGAAEDRFGASLASFTGVYNAKGFRVNAR